MFFNSMPLTVMKTKNIILILILTMTCLPLVADTSRVDIRKLTARSNSGKLVVSMEFVFDELKLKADQLMAFQPVITSADGQHNVPLTPLLLTGRRAHIYHERAGSDNYPDAIELRRMNGTEQTYAYTDVIAYQPWMKGATLAVMQDLCACGDKLEQATAQTIRVDYEPFDEVQYAFVTPPAETRKLREVSGSALLNYRVNATEIDASYMENTAELDKIRSTINKVKEDPNVNITAVSIHGYASPEGSYENNERLARERMQSLLGYVKGLHRFDGVRFDVASTPEDWEGFRRMVSESSLTHRDEILKLIDSNEDPDRKEHGIRAAYPDDYRILLASVYPLLRHADYTVQYVVRPFTSEEAAEIFRTKPSQLSLEELYLLAQTYPAGSEEYNKVFMTAAYMYPNDEVANINAANVALRSRDDKAAERFLTHAGDTAEAENARGILHLLRGEAEAAAASFARAAQEGLQQADYNLNLLK
jgi:outer membrane protein OmpA-like peptidoglycan-associated protein